MQSLLPGSSKHEVKVVGLQTQICKCVIWTIFGSWSNDVGNIKTSKAFIYPRGRGLGRLNRNGVGEKSLRYFLWVHWSFKILSEGHESFLTSLRPKCYNGYFIKNFIEMPSNIPFHKMYTFMKAHYQLYEGWGGGGSYKFWRCPRGGRGVKDTERGAVKKYRPSSSQRIKNEHSLALNFSC